MNNSVILTPDTQSSSELAKIVAIHPTSSKLLVECLKVDEMMGTKLYVGSDANMDGAPQAFIVELGPNVAPHCGLKVGQRVYWNGQGTPVQDPRAQHGRVRALMEIHNIIAIIEDENSQCCKEGECEK